MRHIIRGLYIQIILEYEDIINMKFLHWVKIPEVIWIHHYQLPVVIEMIAKCKNRNESVIIQDNLIEKNTIIIFDELLEDIM